MNVCSRWTLEVFIGPNQGASVTIPGGKPLTVGSGETADVVIADPGVAAHQIGVETSPDGRRLSLTPLATGLRLLEHGGWRRARHLYAGRAVAVVSGPTWITCGATMFRFLPSVAPVPPAAMPVSSSAGPRAEAPRRRRGPAVTAGAAALAAVGVAAAVLVPSARVAEVWRPEAPAPVPERPRPAALQRATAPVPPATWQEASARAERDLQARLQDAGLAEFLTVVASDGRIDVTGALPAAKWPVWEEVKNAVEGGGRPGVAYDFGGVTARGPGAGARVRDAAHGAAAATRAAPAPAACGEPQPGPIRRTTGATEACAGTRSVPTGSDDGEAAPDSKPPPRGPTPGGPS